VERGTRRVASIIVLGLLVVGTILNLDWFIDSMQNRDNVSIVSTTISSPQTQQNQHSHNERAYTKPVEKIVLLGEQHSDHFSEDDSNSSDSPASKTDQHMDIPHLWLDVITYAEGIAGWKTSLLELLYFAQKMNGGASLVEPCMKSGRLWSCGERYETRRGVPVSEIFDLDKYMMVPRSVDGNSRHQYPLLVSYDDYQKVPLEWQKCVCEIMTATSLYMDAVPMRHL
jgi:hypothetical protein